MEKKIRIKLKSYDHLLLDMAVQKVEKLLNDKKCPFAGAIPLPMKKKRYTVNRSPHVNKESREQFEQRQHYRILDVLSNQKEAIKAIESIDFSGSVELKIEI